MRGADPGYAACRFGITPHLKHACNGGNRFVRHRKHAVPDARGRQQGGIRPVGRRRAAGQPDGFAAELQRSIRRVTAAQNAASAQAKAFELGAPDVSLNDVMVDMQKASIGFSTAIQVRNKLVAAYKEISSMAV